MGTGKHGGSNAALLAVQILSLKRPELENKLRMDRQKMAEQVEAASRKLNQKA
jgi:phosphoribosylcarboxyaminoimidazole (NCAIR) mutase